MNHQGREQGRSTISETKFEGLLPDVDVTPSNLSGELAGLVQQMVRMASETTFPPLATTMGFLPVSSFFYSDGSGMFTLSGVVCDTTNERKVRDAFTGWEFANLSWDPPKRISVPVLSTQERLHLQTTPTYENKRRVKAT